MVCLRRASQGIGCSPHCDERGEPDGRDDQESAVEGRKVDKRQRRWSLCLPGFRGHTWSHFRAERHVNNKQDQLKIRYLLRSTSVAQFLLLIRALRVLRAL